ncbi:MAG: DUF4386 domain-containing protein [Proteobacteria bacterium]|nr:DUF4386 domain-containing protein [Pseudomonadota bacterium]
MTNPVADVSQRNAGIIAGIGFAITIAGVILASIGGAIPGIIVPGDAAATAKKIIDSGELFRVGISGWLIAIIGDVIRAWALYVFFKRVNKSIALLAAWWMLLHDAIFGFANTCLIMVSELLNGSGYFAGLALETLHPLMMLLLEMHFYGFEIGLFFFSFHLILLGYLALKSDYVPRILGVLVLIAGFGYLVDSAGLIILSNYPDLLTNILALPNIVGELALVAWLAFKGGKSPSEAVNEI